MKGQLIAMHWMPRRAPHAIVTAILLLGPVASTTACAGEPVLGRPRTVTVQAMKAATFGYPDLNRHEMRNALLDGPHYSLAVQWVATGEKLEKQAATQLGTSPLRPADGEQLILAGVDAERAYAAFPVKRGHPVRVSVLIGGRATPLPNLPLHPAPTTSLPAKTQVIEVGAARSASVVLRAVDDGHTEELDLRTGRVLVDTYRIEQGKARWDSNVPVAAYGPSGPERGSIAALNAIGAENAQASLTTYTAAYGWAPKGHAFLTVPMPRLVCGVTVCVTLHEVFDDSKAFRFQPTHGHPVAAERRHRDLWLTSVGGENPHAAVVFEVPDDITGGTVSLDLAAATLTEDGHGNARHPSKHGRTVGWSRPPAPLTLPLHLTS